MGKNETYVQRLEKALKKNLKKRKKFQDKISKGSKKIKK